MYGTLTDTHTGHAHTHAHLHIPKYGCMFTHSHVCNPAQNTFTHGWAHIYAEYCVRTSNRVAVKRKTVPLEKRKPYGRVKVTF